MVNQRYCPFCKAPAIKQCRHLALAVEGKNFVRRCIELAESETQWSELCSERRKRNQLSGDWTPEREDFIWLETAFCDEFLRHLTWFGGMDHEWRSGPGLDQGGFWVLLWSKDPQRLWWELRDELERQILQRSLPPARFSGSQINLNYRRL
jgi:hypothetical protein